MLAIFKRRAKCDGLALPASVFKVGASFLIGSVKHGSGPVCGC